MKKIIALTILFLISLSCTTQINHVDTKQFGRWNEGKINQWYKKQGWLVGCNYTTSSAVNQLEMWQSDTFDPELIDKELGWAEELGFTSMRVFLHSLVWLNDSIGLKDRINQYLTISEKHGISTMFVLLDDCWNPEAQYGPQPEPKPGIHNSGWVQDPIVSMRSDTLILYPIMEKYIKDIIGTFKDDKRLIMWDLYNEPGNSSHGITSLPLLKKVFKWAREINPSQPLTSGMWNLNLSELSNFQLNASDIISYHCYLNKEQHKSWLNWLKLYNRPLVCTEWMGRRFDSTFEKIMPMLKDENVAAYNWGFVAGKTNTIFAWDDPRPDGKEPELWFHDIIRKDGTPFDSKEIDIIKSLTLVK